MNGRLAAAFAALYIAWGSTYLAIRFAIETIPPLLMASARFLVAGVILYIGMRLAKTPAPTRQQWGSAAIVGTFLLLGGNGMVVLAEQVVPSGITALLIGTTPFWMTLLGWLWQGERRPSYSTVLGLLLGFVGLVLLVNPFGAAAERVHPWGALAVIAATLSWAIGSLWSRRLDQSSSPFMASAMQMIAGGIIILPVASILGEWGRLDLQSISSRSAAALVYLIVFGSLIGFSAYIYVLKHSRPAMAATYAYVNPIIAVLLGWLLAGEKFSAMGLLGGGIIVAAVVLITRNK